MSNTILHLITKTTTCHVQTHYTGCLSQLMSILPARGGCWHTGAFWGLAAPHHRAVHWGGAVPTCLQTLHARVGGDGGGAGGLGTVGRADAAVLLHYTTAETQWADCSVCQAQDKMRVGSLLVTSTGGSLKNHSSSAEYYLGLCILFAKKFLLQPANIIKKKF